MPLLISVGDDFLTCETRSSLPFKANCLNLVPCSREFYRQIYQKRKILLGKDFDFSFRRINKHWSNEHADSRGKQGSA